MSRKKFGTAGAAFAAESFAAAAFATESLAAGAVSAAFGAESLAAVRVCAAATCATVVRVSMSPSAADRCRSKGPPGDMSTCRSAGSGRMKTSRGLERSGVRRLERFAADLVGGDWCQRRVVLLARANADDPLDGLNEDLAVADGAGARAFD